MKRHTARLSVERLEDRALPSTFAVLNLADSGDGSLRAAILSAEAKPGADVIQFAPNIHGTITLTTGELFISTDLTINGPGENQLSVCGNDASRVFHVQGGADAPSAITVGISELTIAHGRASEGGGINNSGFSDLTISGVILSDNLAVGTASTDARGGGAFVSGSGSTLNVVDSLVIRNTADGRMNATRGGGGGLTAVLGGRLNMLKTTVADNRAFGGRVDLSGAGGGITISMGATAGVSDSVIRDNRAFGAVGGGPGHGGGILTTGAGTSLVLSHSVLIGNHAFGGDGALGFQGQAWGGAIDVRLGARASISDSVFTENRAIAGSGGLTAAGDGSTSTAGGGAVSCGVMSPTASFVEVTRSTLRANQAIGGNNARQTAANVADVGSAHGGALYVTGGSEAVIRDSTIRGNKAIGGDGNTGDAPVGFVGTATGGGIDNANAALAVGGAVRQTKLTVSNSILADNEAIGGAGNTGGGSHVFLSAGLGGGIANYLGGATVITGSLLILNRATGHEGGLGAGGGIFNALGNFSTNGGLLGPSLMNVTSSVLVLNLAQGEPGSGGFGGGAYNDATSALTLRTSIIIRNLAVGGPGGRGIGGGVYNLGTTNIDAVTRIVANEADEHDDCFGCP